MVMARGMYHFQGQPRFQAWFDSPNTCAAVLALGLLVLIGTWAASLHHKKCSFKWNWCLLVGGSLLVGLGSIFLTLTYSRGGWAGYMVGLGALALSHRSLRKVALLTAVVFVALLFILPRGWARTETVWDTEDKSIRHRTIVWEGAAILAMQHPWLGVGWGKFGDTYHRWVQPLELRPFYLNALNSPLHLGAELGLPALAGLTVITLSPFWWVWQRARRSRHLWAFGLVSGGVSFLVAGWFTALIVIPESAWWFGGLWLVALIYTLWPNKSLTPKIGLTSWLGLPVGGALFLCLVIGISGSYLAHRLPVIVDRFHLNNREAVMFSPQARPIHGVLTYHLDGNEGVNDLARNTLRRLAEKGWIVLVADVDSPPDQRVTEVRALLHIAQKRAVLLHLPLVGIGLNSSARALAVAACSAEYPSLRAIATVGSAYNWPDLDQSPADHLQNLQCPWLIIHARRNHIVPIQEAVALAEACTKLGKRHEFVPLEESSHFLTTQERLFVMDQMEIFFRQSLR
jgi:pimeloyl-ACP methyl ester carboxylesterase